MLKRIVILGATLCALEASPAVAQEVPTSGWKFILAPYLLFPHMDGNVTVGPVNSDISVSASDIFSNLQFGAMLAAEARSQLWAIGFDGLYMNLSKDGQNLPTEYGGHQAMLEFTGFRRFVPWLEVLAGGRINFMGANAKLQDGSGDLLNKDIAFFDPFLGVRLTAPHTGRWTLSLRGDVGGFGVGSQFAWQIRPTVAYSVSRHVAFGFAYWAMGINYNNGKSGIEYFKYDVTTFGPELGVAFTF